MWGGAPIQDTAVLPGGEWALIEVTVTGGEWVIIEHEHANLWGYILYENRQRKKIHFKSKFRYRYVEKIAVLLVS